MNKRMSKTGVNFDINRQQRQLEVVKQNKSGKSESAQVRTEDLL